MSDVAALSTEERAGSISRSGASFGALRSPDFGIYVLALSGAMMLDNVEHIITYWVLFQTFHSPLLGGYAVISHWLPLLFFSFHAGVAADRYDCRRLIQVSLGLFMAVSLMWGVLIVTESLHEWQALALLSLHGIAVVIWGPAGQLMIHDMVGEGHLHSAVRLAATGRQIAVLIGPGLGGGLMLAFGPGIGMLINGLLYLPAMLWLNTVRYTGHSGSAAGMERVRGRGWREIRFVLREVSSSPALLAMVALSSLSALFVGNAFQAQMPEYAADLGAGGQGYAYAALQAASAAGAIFGGIALESWGLLHPRARTAIFTAALWCLAMIGFAAAGSYPLALGLLVLAGAFRLAFSSMAQTLVQLLAPADIRGRVLGVFNMSLGLQAGSGITVGVVGSIIGVRPSLALSGLALLISTIVLLALVSRGGRPEREEAQWSGARDGRPSL